MKLTKTTTDDESQNLTIVSQRTRYKRSVALRYFPSMWKKQQYILAHKSNLTRNISMETLSKEFKPIFLENN